MTDLRDQLAAIPLTDRRGTGHILWRIRTDLGISLDGLALRLRMSRSGVHRREAHGYLPTSALIDHAQALGYQVTLTPTRYRPTGTGWPDAALTPDRDRRTGTGGHVSPPPHNRTTGIHALRHPTETDARNALDTNDRNLPYLGIWQPPDRSVTGPGLHMFSNHRTPADLQADGWTREDT